MKSTYTNHSAGLQSVKLNTKYISGSMKSWSGRGFISLLSKQTVEIQHMPIWGKIQCIGEEFEASPETVLAAPEAAHSAAAG